MSTKRNDQENYVFAIKFFLNLCEKLRLRGCGACGAFCTEVMIGGVACRAVLRKESAKYDDI